MEKKKSKNIWLIIMSVLILAELVCSVYTCFVSRFPVYAILSMIPLIGVAAYGFWLYKKPHGNMLKYAMLLSALFIVISSLMQAYNWGEEFAQVFTPVLAACLMFYVAGRLNRIDQNKYLLPIIVLILLVDCILELAAIPTETSSVIMVTRYIAAPRQIFIVLSYMIAYFVRYKEHKEAGLMDAPKK